MGRTKKAVTVILPAAKKSIVQWCKTLHEAGNELTMKWEGGGDSGWCYFEIDGETTDNEYTRALVDRMDETLNYGSWAGEFNASGTAIYNPETNSFEGTDFYGEDESDYEDIDITIRVPKSFWFDSLSVEVEANYDEGSNVSARFILKNGFLTEKHTELCSNLETSLPERFNSIFDNYSSKNGAEFRSCMADWNLERADAIEGDEDLIFKITTVEFGVMTNEERTIVLELDEETVIFIDQQLNEEEHAE